MLVKYRLSTEGGFRGGENVNPVGVLVSGVGLLSLLVLLPVTGGDMTHCWEEVVLCDVVLFFCSLVVCAAAVQLGKFVDDAAAVVWAAAVAVSADVFVLVVPVLVALAAVVLTSWACAAVTACLVVDPGPGSAVALVHVAG